MHAKVRDMRRKKNLRKVVRKVSLRTTSIWNAIIRSTLKKAHDEEMKNKNTGFE